MGLLGSIANAGESIGLSAENVIRWIVSSGNFRGHLNGIYNNWSKERKEAFHEKFSRIFRDQPHEGVSGEWNFEFSGVAVKAPLRTNEFWLDWDSAISYLGHDVDVKTSYDELLKSENRPKVFFDIGANYGTHTLLMATSGVDCTPFEPNPNCLAYFKAALELNGLDLDIQKIGLGAENRTADLWFPEGETWLGTLDQGVKNELDSDYKLIKEVVNITTLDGFVKASGKHPDLIKIDTEGHEVDVLMGGKETLTNDRPVILFESNDSEQRKKLRGLFAEYNYQIVNLPLKRGIVNKSLSETDFADSVKNNFAAIPPNFSLN